jgi:hypothetical protein
MPNTLDVTANGLTGLNLSYRLQFEFLRVFPTHLLVWYFLTP